jgi:hypothetical protein
MTAEIAILNKNAVGGWPRRVARPSGFSNNLEGAPSKLCLGGGFRWWLLRPSRSRDLSEHLDPVHRSQLPHPNVANDATLGWGTLLVLFGSFLNSGERNLHGLEDSHSLSFSSRPF